MNYFTPITGTRLSLYQDVLGLSSGTLSTWVRHAIDGNQGNTRFHSSHTADYWYLGQIRQRFALHIIHSPCIDDSVADAWRSYIEKMGSVKFIVSYQGESDFFIDNGGYSVRSWGDPHYKHWNTGVWDGQILPTIGTIRRCSGVLEWPSPIAVSMFPGYVPARWDTETKSIVYHDEFGPPVLRTDRTTTGYVYAKAAHG